MFSSLNVGRKWSYVYPFLTAKRYTHEIRVRFAPSPTGYLHLGGLRTALYNYLFAKNRNGKFLLRIEDTDQTRLVAGAAQSIVDDLNWAGITIDEGPGIADNKYGPYVQSERTDIYMKAVHNLLENDTAYRCFCTERRLELLRKEALRLRQVPRYDNKCRHLSKQQTQDLIGKGVPFCIRFKLTDYLEPFEDLIYGNVRHNVSDTEGDPVIIKTDNFPTYHFANVVDDHLMNVTHVLRGVEWQISTTKHLLLYRAFDWQPPKFGHLPLLVNADGTKLSKRQGDIGIKSFREKGYFPLAILNYVVSAGGGFEQDILQSSKLLSMQELVQQFNISKVNSHPSRLNPNLVEDFNRSTIIRQLEKETTRAELVQEVQSLVEKTFPKEKNLDLNEDHVANVLKWSTDRLTRIQDLTSSKLSFLWVKPSNFKWTSISEAQLQKLLTKLENLSYEKDNLNELLKQFAHQEDIKFPILMKSLRSALSGLKEGPGVAEMMQILGKQVVLERLKASKHVDTNEKDKSKSAL